jgi:hypothetical protein
MKSPDLPTPNDDAAQALLDDDSPASARKTFVVLMAVAGVVCLLPRQWASAGICFAASAAIGIAHAVIARRTRPSSK